MGQQYWQIVKMIVPDNETGIRKQNAVCSQIVVRRQIDEVHPLNNKYRHV